MDRDLLWARLGEVSASAGCPICRNETWNVVTIEGDVLPHIVPAVQPGGTVMPGKGLGVFALGCAKCGFLRLHATQTLFPQHEASDDS